MKLVQSFAFVVLALTSFTSSLSATELTETIEESEICVLDTTDDTISGTFLVTSATETSSTCEARKRWIWPKYGCKNLDVNREYFQKIMDELFAETNVDLRGKPLTEVVIALSEIKDRAEIFLEALKMAIQLSSLELFCKLKLNEQEIVE